LKQKRKNWVLSQRRIPNANKQLSNLVNLPQGVLLDNQVPKEIVNNPALQAIQLSVRRVRRITPIHRKRIGFNALNAKSGGMKRVLIMRVVRISFAITAKNN